MSTRRPTCLELHLATWALALAVAGAARAAPAPADPPASPSALSLPAAQDDVPPDLAQQVRALLDRSLPLPAEEARLEVQVGRLDPRLRLAPCRRIEPYLPTGTALWGRTRIGLRCVEGEKLWNVSLPVVVRVFAPALVVHSALPAGTTLEARHLQRAETDLAAHASAALTDPAQVIGRVLVRPLPAGGPLRQADLRQRQWFAVGDSVQVVARGAGFVVMGEGQALSAGVEGQLAKVRTEGGRVLSAMPVGERRVEVSL
jgi:flagella basal body P-ring formation protein FlgA